MAKVVTNEQRIVVEPWWGKLRILFTGAGLGLIWWVLASLLKRYVIEPIACQNLNNANVCIDSFGVAGNIAIVLVTVIGVYVLIRSSQPRPIIISVASAVMLWGLAGFMTGLAWYETLLWAVGLFALTYALFSMVVRIHSLVFSLITAAVVLLAVRLLLSL